MIRQKNWQNNACKQAAQTVLPASVIKLNNVQQLAASAYLNSDKNAFLVAGRDC